MSCLWAYLECGRAILDQGYFVEFHPFHNFSVKSRTRQ
jgi:hypothetical protein